MKKIVSFFKSEKMIYIIQLIVFCSLKTTNCGILLGIILNSPKDKYFYFQIFFEVLEQLINSDYLNHINDLAKKYKKYSNKDEKIKKQTNEFKEYNNFTKKMNKKEIIFIKKFESNKNYDLKKIKEQAPFLIEFAKLSLTIVFNGITKPYKIDSYLDLFKALEKYIAQLPKEDAISLVNYLSQLNFLYQTKELHQRLVYFINLIIHKEKITKLLGKPIIIGDFKELSSKTKLSENIVFYVFEELKTKIYEKIHIITNKYEEEIFSVEMFESKTIKESKNSLSRIICKSIFTDRELIIEKLNLNYEISIEEIGKELQEEIQFLINKKYSYKNLFLQIDNKLFRCPESYDVFIKEILKYIFILMINKKEKNKEKEKEEQIKNALVQIVEKENKIKELELKLSRYPFELNEGEQLMTIIIKSNDNKINIPILCQNTFKFNRIEEIFYELFNEFEEKDNIFTLNGNKINRNKSLEENNVKDRDIIIIESN